LRAIIVDDEALSIKRLRRLLPDSGLIATCETFHQPQDAYAYAQANPVDVAFLDISMPRINGMKLSALLSELHPEIRVIFVTGYEEYALQAFEIQAVDYLMKPVEAERLEKTLDRIRKARRMDDSQPEISVRLFDGLQIYLNRPESAPITLRSPKTEELFAYLICKGAAGRAEIAEALWPDLDAGEASHNLNTHLYYIRETRDLNAHSLFRMEHGEIRVDRSKIDCDLYHFEQASKQILTEGVPDLRLVDRVEQWYAGPLLGGRDYRWLSDLANHSERTYIRILEMAAKHCLAESRFDAAIRYYAEILNRDGLREDIFEVMISLHLKLGRKSDADRYYERMRSIMLHKFGTAPNADLINP